MLTEPTFYMFRNLSLSNVFLKIGLRNYDFLKNSLGTNSYNYYFGVE